MKPFFSDWFNIRNFGSAILIALLALGEASPAVSKVPQIEKVSFADLSGWKEDDHLSALKSFQRFCRNPESVKGGLDSLRLTRAEVLEICERAGDLAQFADQEKARRFFEENFQPFKITQNGFVTGYFEPEVSASRQKSEEYNVPLHRKPPGLEAVPAENLPEGWPQDLTHGRRIEGVLTEMPDRAAIMEGALDEESLEFAWLADPVATYFIHVQGSARLRLQDGSVMRVGYAGKTGHPYTGIARLLVKRGEGTPEDFTMSGLKEWLHSNADKRDQLFKENLSYIFFREIEGSLPEDGPIGAAGLPLTAGRSLAVDNSFIPYGSFVFLVSSSNDLEDPTSSFRRLMIADDTGSAIKGNARGDIFVGSGQNAGDLAGEIRHPASFTVLLPKGKTFHETAD